MNLDWIPWVSRAVLIAAGIIAVILVVKKKKEYYFGIFVIGSTAFVLGVIVLVVSLITGLTLFYALYLIGVGAIALTLGLIIRNRLRKNR